MPRSHRLTGWDSLQILTKLFSDQQVRAVVEFEGRLDEARLAGAIRTAVAVEPVLGCRVQRRFWHPRWKPLRSFDADALLKVVESYDTDTAVRQLLIEDLDPWRGPIFRISLVRGDSDTLVVNLDHTAGDAASVRLLTQLLASSYSRPAPATPAPARPYYDRRGFQSLLGLLPGGRRSGKPVAPSAGPRPPWRFPWRPAAAPGEKRIEMRRLSPERTATVLAYAGQKGAWLNDVLLAAYFRALARLIGPSEAVPALTIPVDLRKYLPAGDRPRIANFSASFTMALKEGIGDSLDDTLERVRAASAETKRGLPGLDQAASLSALADRVPFRIIEWRLAHGKAPISLPPPWFIALGVLRPESFAFGPVRVKRAYVLPSITRAGGVFQLSASCFASSLTLAVCFSGDEVNAGSVKRFLELYLTELPS
jgi:NRPS condensation-like uncharacterized protein